MSASVRLCWIRRALVVLSALAVILFARPAGATSPTDPADLQVWARRQAAPPLAVTHLAAGDAAASASRLRLTDAASN